MYEHLTQILRNLFDYQPREPGVLFKQREISNPIDSYSFAQKQYSCLSVYNIE